LSRPESTVKRGGRRYQARSEPVYSLLRQAMRNDADAVGSRLVCPEGPGIAAVVRVLRPQ